MKPQQIALIVLASIGALFLLTLATGLFRARFGDSCYVETRRVVESPSRVNILYYEILACTNKAGLARLSFQGRKKQNTIHTFLETASKHETPAGVIHDPVTFGIAWSGDYAVKIFYPEGLEIYNWVEGYDPSAPGVLDLEIEEVQVEIVPSET